MKYLISLLILHFSINNIITITIIIVMIMIMIIVIIIIIAYYEFYLMIYFVFFR